LIRSSIKKKRGGALIKETPSREKEIQAVPSQSAPQLVKGGPITKEDLGRNNFSGGGLAV